MPTISYPYNPAAIVSPSVADDNKFKQTIEFFKQILLQGGWTELTDSGYLQQWSTAMAFSTVSNGNAGVTAGGTSNASPAQYPNLAMDTTTTTYWQSNGQPVLGAANYAVGYDAGVGNTVSPIYYNLWLQGAGAATDPYSWVLEYADTMDTNYDWAGATWTCIDSVVASSTVATNLSCASALIGAAGSGYIINTTASVSGTYGNGAILQPVITTGGVSSVLIADPGVGYHAGDAITFTPYSASGVTLPTGWSVGTVNAAGQILTITSGTTGSGLVANPVCASSIGTATWAVFTNSAFGVAGGVAQVIPCVVSGQTGASGYTAATPPTLTITQSSGGSSPTGATATAKLTVSTGGAAQLNRFDIPIGWWANSTTGPTHRAFRLRVLANVSSTTSVNIYEFQLYNYGATYVNSTPARLAPTSSQTNTYPGWKIFCMGDTIQSSGCPLYMKVWLGNAGTWNYPSFQVALGQGTDGMGNLVGPQVTSTITVSGAAGSSTAAPLYAVANTSWAHITLFKSTSAEVSFHIERIQTSATNGTDSSNGVGFAYANTAGAQTVIMPQYGAAPVTETSWGAILGNTAGSTYGANTQLEMIRLRNKSWSPPFRRMTVCETASGLPDGTNFTAYDPYGNSVGWFVDAVNCTKVIFGAVLTTGRIAVKNTQ